MSSTTTTNKSEIDKVIKDVQAKKEMLLKNFKSAVTTLGGKSYDELANHMKAHPYNEAQKNIANALVNKCWSHVDELANKGKKKPRMAGKNRIAI